MNKVKKTSSKKRSHKILKKIGRAIYRFFEIIYKIFDKLLITPLSKLIILVGKLFKTNNKLKEEIEVAVRKFYEIDNSSNKNSTKKEDK